MKKLLFTFCLTSLFLIFSSNTEANAAYTDEELETIRESNEEYVLELTYEQAMERIAELSGKTIEQVKLENPKVLPNTRSSNICGWVDTATSIKSKTKDYTVTLLVVVESCRNGSFQWINADKLPPYVGIVADSKTFAGDAALISIDANGFYYLVNGKLHNHATVSHGGTTGVSALWTTTYTLTSGSSFYDNIDTRTQYRKLIR